MQLYAVNSIPLPGPLYMFRVFYTPIIRNTIFNYNYSHWYKPHYHLSYLLPVWPGTYRTANLQNCILYIYSTNIGTEYFKHGVYFPFFFFLFKMQFVS